MKLFDFGLCGVLPRGSEHSPGPPPTVGALAGGAAAEVMEDDQADGGAAAAAALLWAAGPTAEGRPMLVGQTGSLRYMAPEVALGAPYDERVDVYSLALVAWEAFHLRKPFGREFFLRPP